MTTPRPVTAAAIGLLTLLTCLGVSPRVSSAQGTTDTVENRADTLNVQKLAPVRVVESAAAKERYRMLRTRSGTRTFTLLRDIPQAISTVNQALIVDQAMRGMGDVVQFLPGIVMGQGEGHRDAPTIRGNSTTADFFVNGVRDDAQYLRDLYNVERVEAVKGANALTFGRGGGGGVLNRVMKEATPASVRQFSLEGGSFGQQRVAIDVGATAGSHIVTRLNAMHENADSFRDRVGLERWGVSPTASWMRGRTKLAIAGEQFVDRRTVDRGIPSFNGRPAPAPVERMFGNPDSSYSGMTVRNASLVVDRAFSSSVEFRNTLNAATYDKFYQNVFPGAVSADGESVAISAYNFAADRSNLFNQADLTWRITGDEVSSIILAGTEFGRSSTSNLRNTGYFDNGATSRSVPFANPTDDAPVAFRQSASDADNSVRTHSASAYLQNQLSVGRHVQLVTGVRWDRFAASLQNRRDGRTYERTDAVLSPRAGLVLKPVTSMSVYGNYSVSFLPSAGEQFASLSASTEALRPERFRNQEIGVKWEVTPALAVSSAVYRLDRTNSTSPHPTMAGVLLQTGRQSTEGWEAELTGAVASRWQVVGGYASQKARISSRTTAAAEGATVPLVPHQTFSLWNRVQVAPRVAAAAGVVHQANSYASIDNLVVLPAFTRLDGAFYVQAVRNLRVQMNIQNMLNTVYFPTSHGNNNIMPGAPRMLRIALHANY